jgi:hypothetical protein
MKRLSVLFAIALCMVSGTCVGSQDSLIAPRSCRTPGEVTSRLPASGGHPPASPFADAYVKPHPHPNASLLHYPRLHANFFSRAPENEAAYEALGLYGAVTTGAIFSDGREGGYDLGLR